MLLIKGQQDARSDPSTSVDQPGSQRKASNNNQVYNIDLIIDHILCEEDMDKSGSTIAATLSEPATVRSWAKWQRQSLSRRLRRGEKVSFRSKVMPRLHPTEEKVNGEGC